MLEKIHNLKNNAKAWDISREREREDQERNTTLWIRGSDKGIEDSQNISF